MPAQKCEMNLEKRVSGGRRHSVHYPQCCSGCLVKVITMENPVSSAVIAGRAQTDSPHALAALRAPSAHNDSMRCGLPQAFTHLMENY